MSIHCPNNSRHPSSRPQAQGRGFTLIEMLIVIVVLGVISSIVVPAVRYRLIEAKIAACRENVRVINTQVERWYLMKGKWPKNRLEDIGSDPDYFPEGPPPCPVDGKAYTLKPAHHRVGGHDHPLP